MKYKNNNDDNEKFIFIHMCGMVGKSDKITQRIALAAHG